MEKINELSQQLGNEIATDPRYLKLKSSIEALEADEEARGAHEEFVELAAALERIEDAGESTAQGGPLEQRLEELAERHPALDQFLDAQTEFSNLMQEVFSTIDGVLGLGDEEDDDE
jgi:cell fate (sporulation/competence/biofilm development) regulator YlbF (YheA/YmcA/DUF963 family)